MYIIVCSGDMESEARAECAVLMLSICVVSFDTFVHIIGRLFRTFLDMATSSWTPLCKACQCHVMQYNVMQVSVGYGLGHHTRSLRPLQR